MSELRPKPEDADAEPSAIDAEEREPALPPPIVTGDELDAEGEPVRRADPLAAGVAVAVMAALVVCAALVLIAAGNG